MASRSSNFLVSLCDQSASYAAAREERSHRLSSLRQLPKCRVEDCERRRHNLDVIKSADWVIDLGPEGGEGGGHIVAEGPPEEIASNLHSHTGKWLARVFVRYAPRYFLTRVKVSEASLLLPLQISSVQSPGNNSQSLSSS